MNTVSPEHRRIYSILNVIAGACILGSNIIALRGRHMFHSSSFGHHEIMVDVVRRLLSAGMANKYLHMMISDEMRISLDEIIKKQPGRPQKIFPGLDPGQRLAVLELLYDGKDIVDISQKTKTNINSIAQFLFSEDSGIYFGYLKCNKCKSTYVWEKDHSCPKCQAFVGLGNLRARAVEYSHDGVAPSRTRTNERVFSIKLLAVQILMLVHNSYLAVLERELSAIKRMKPPFLLWVKGKT